jgi:hypothetical protein
VWPEISILLGRVFTTSATLASNSRLRGFMTELPDGNMEIFSRSSSWIRIPSSVWSICRFFSSSFRSGAS